MISALSIDKVRLIMTKHWEGNGDSIWKILELASKLNKTEFKVITEEKILEKEKDMQAQTSWKKMKGIARSRIHED